MYIHARMYTHVRICTHASSSVGFPDPSYHTYTQTRRDLSTRRVTLTRDPHDRWLSVRTECRDEKSTRIFVCLFCLFSVHTHSHFHFVGIATKQKPQRTSADQFGTIAQGSWRRESTFKENDHLVSLKHSRPF